MKTFTEYLNEAKKELLHPEIKVGTIINVDFQHFYKIIKRTDKSVTYVEVEKENKHDKMSPIINEIKKKAQPITINFAKSYVENNKKGFMIYLYPNDKTSKRFAHIWDGKPVEVQRDKTYDGMY